MREDKAGMLIAAIMMVVVLVYSIRVWTTDMMPTHAACDYFGHSMAGCED